MILHVDKNLASCQYVFIICQFSKLVFFTNELITCLIKLSALFVIWCPGNESLLLIRQNRLLFRNGILNIRKRLENTKLTNIEINI